jgi:predicted MFS family arabinose efflux permease
MRSADDSPTRPAPPPLTRAEWGLILVLLMIQFTHMVDFVIIMPLGGRLMGELGIGTREFGAVVSAYAWAAGLASLVGGAVMDRFDRRSLLLVMYAGFTLATLFCGLAPGYGWLLVGRVLAGATGGLSAVAIMAVIGDAFEPAKRGRAIGAVTSAFAVASIAGLPIGLEIAAWFGRGAPFVALAGLSAGVWAVGWWRLPAVRGHLSAARRDPLAEYAAVAREPNHLWAFAFSFFLVMGTFTVAAFIGPYLSATNGWTEADLKWLYLAAGLCTLVGMNVVGRLADRTGRRPLFRAMAVGALVMAVAITTVPMTTLPAAAVMLSLFMVLAAGRMVPAQAILLGAARPEVRGAFLSLNTAVQHVATGAAPMVAGALLTTTTDAAGRVVSMAGFPLVGLVAAGTAAVSLVLAGRVRPAAATPVIAEPRQEPAAVDAEPKAAAV